MDNIQRGGGDTVHFGQKNLLFKAQNTEVFFKSKHQRISYKKKPVLWGEGRRRINCLPHITSHTFQKYIFYYTKKNHCDIIIKISAYLIDIILLTKFRLIWSRVCADISTWSIYNASKQQINYLFIFSPIEADILPLLSSVISMCVVGIP
jgi:hypothetical protein